MVDSSGLGPAFGSGGYAAPAARGLCWCLALAGLVAIASPAAGAPSCPVQSPSRANVVVAGNDQAVEAAGDGLVRALGRSGVTARLTRAEHIDPGDVARPVPCEPGVVARLFVDLESPTSMTLYLADAGAKRVFVRRFALDHGLDLVALESLELVAQSSVETLLAGQELGVEREEYGRSLPPPRPTAEPRAVVAPAPKQTTALRATGFYEISMLGPDVIQQGPGLGIEYEWSAGRMGASIHVRLPVHFEDTAFAGQLLPEGVRIFFARPLVLSPRTTASAGIAGGLDVTEVRADARQADAVAVPSFWVVDPLVRGFGTIEHRVGVFRFSAMLGAEFDLVAAHYVVAQESDRPSVFVPWRLRPVGAIIVGAEL
jgi:hypothetical protein